MKRVLYCERCMARNVLWNERSNIYIDPSAMDAKRLVVYHASVGLAVRLQWSTNDLREVDRTDGRKHFEQRTLFWKTAGNGFRKWCWIMYLNKFFFTPKFFLFYFFLRVYQCALIKLAICRWLFHISSWFHALSIRIELQTIVYRNSLIEYTGDTNERHAKTYGTTFVLSSSTIINNEFRNNVNVKLSKSRTVFSKISQNFFLILLKET